MSKYKKNAQEFEKLLCQAKSSGEPVVTAVQKKREPGELHDFQKEILESMSNFESCNTIISISKSRPKKGEPITIKIDHIGKKLIPLNKNK